MTTKSVKAGYKLVFGLLGFSAIVTEIATLVSEGAFQPANFFSFFTIQSNIIAAAVLLIGALYVFAGKNSKRFDYIRGAATFYIAVTGIVFAFLLSGLQDARLTAVPWDNIVLHYLIPIMMVVDWLIDPPKQRISFSRALVWISYPIAYLVYSLIRGAIVGWYPYPFLNPDNGGYATVLLLSLIITVFGVLGIFVITRVTKRLR